MKDKEIKKKPPLGLIPEHTWKRMRIRDIVAAMDRYNDTGNAIPSEWFTELYGLV